MNPHSNVLPAVPAADQTSSQSCRRETRQQVGETDPIAQFNAAFAYHFAEHITPDAHTLQLMAEFALARGRRELASCLLTLLEAQY